MNTETYVRTLMLRHKLQQMKGTLLYMKHLRNQLERRINK